MQSNPAVWFEIYVDDMERAKTFYTTVLNTELQKHDSPELEMWTFPMEGCSPASYGANGALAKMEGVKAGNNSTVVYFACEDCAIEAGRVEAAGGKVHREKFSIGEYGFIALATDTEGNMFGLHSMA